MKRIISIAIIGTTLFSATGVYAIAEVPLLMKMWATAKDKLKVAQKGLNTAQKVKNDAGFIKNALTGHYKMGDLVDVPLKSQEWSPGAWADAMQNTTDGASLQYLQATSIFSDSHKLLTETEFTKGGGNEKDYKAYKAQWETDRAANAVAETAYGKINKDEEDIKTLQKHIESAPNEKAAQDLQNRIAVEQADINVQQQRIKTVQLKLEAEKRSEALDAKRREVEFEK